jgi:hypothetical protein
MSKLYELLNTMIDKVNSSVKTTAQNMTEEEKANVKSNLGYTTPEDIPTQVQADLAQNDPTQPDYVKNRTHYEETVIGAIIESQTIEEGDYFYGVKELPSVGHTYSVVFDGVSYECVAWLHDEFGAVVIGSGSFFESDGNGENVPFGIGFVAYPGGITAYFAGDEGEHTVEVRGEMVVIHKLDAKFMSDSREIVETTIEFREPSSPIRSAIIDNTTVYFIPFGLSELNTGDMFRLIRGETYTFKAPTGKEYTVVAECWGPNTPVSFFAEGDDGETYMFEDVGSYQQCLVYSGTGIDVGYSTNEYSICGKFYKTPVIDVAEDTMCVYAHAERPWINDRHRINGKQVSHGSFIGWLCGDSLNNAKMEMNYGWSTSNENVYAHPIRMQVFCNDNIIEVADFTFRAYDSGANSIVKILDLINCKYVQVES